MRVVDNLLHLMRKSLGNQGVYMEIKDIVIIGAMALGIITKFIVLIVGGAGAMSFVASLIHLAF